MITELQPRTDRRDRGMAVGRVALMWAPPVLAAAYLCTLLTRFSQLIGVTYLNSDSASAPLIGELFGSRKPEAQVILGHLGWYSSLFFEVLTRELPLHRQIWEAAPYALVLTAAGMVAWGASQLAGRWAAAVSATVMLCAGPTLLSLQFVLNDHAPTWFTLSLVAAFVVYAERARRRISTGMMSLIAIIVGVVLGLNSTSDSLLIVAGAIPLALATGAVWWLTLSAQAARAAKYAVLCLLAAAVSGVAFHILLNADHVVSANYPRTGQLVAQGAVSGNLTLWWQNIVVLGDGDFFEQTVGFSAALAVICAALTLAAVVMAFRLVKAELGAAIAAKRTGGKDVATFGAQLAWAIFWASSFVLTSGAFILSGMPEGLASARYLVGPFYAVAALVPFLAARRTARTLVGACVAIYAFAGVWGLAHQRIVEPMSPTYSDAAAIARIAHSEHLAFGYGGYWDAAAITWATHLKIKVYPVDDCDGNLHLCPFEEHQITSWYTPEKHARSFLLADATYPAPAANPTNDLGSPLKTHQIGPITMYVYSYDIASRFLP